MDYKAAINALKKIDASNVDELVSSIEGHVAKLEEKSYETIGDLRKNSIRVRVLQETVNSIASLVGVEGEDLESSLEAKIKELADNHKAASTKVSELETRATEAERKVQTFERQTKISEIAAAAGANAAVLERLLGDKLDQLKVEGEGDQRVVKLGDVALKDAIGSDEGLKPFEAALFPTQQKQEQKATPKLPGGSPVGKTEKSDVLSKYAERSYGGIKVLAKAKTEDAGI